MVTTPIMGVSAELVARAICKARGRNPDMCVFGSSGMTFVDGKSVYTSECSRYAWQDELGLARAIITAIAADLDARGSVLCSMDEAREFQQRAFDELMAACGGPKPSSPNTGS